MNQSGSANPVKLGVRRGSAVDHVQRLLLDRVCHALEHRCRARADVGVDFLEPGDIPLHLPQHRICAFELTVDVEGRRRVVVHLEPGCPRRQLRPDVHVDFADLVRRAGRRCCPRTVRVRVRKRAVGLRRADPPAKWSPSSTVTMNSVLLWSMPSFFSRSKYAAKASSYALSCALYPPLPAPTPVGTRVERSRKRGRVVVVGVRDVAPRDRNARLLHLGQVAERVLRQRLVEAGEAGSPERVGHRLAGRVVHGLQAVDRLAGRSRRRADRRVDVLRPEQRGVAEVAARFV